MKSTTTDLRTAHTFSWVCKIYDKVIWLFKWWWYFATLILTVSLWNKIAKRDKKVCSMSQITFFTIFFSSFSWIIRKTFPSTSCWFFFRKFIHKFNLGWILYSIFSFSIHSIYAVWVNIGEWSKCLIGYSCYTFYGHLSLSIKMKTTKKNWVSVLSVAFHTRN
jgi:hypothetical protein